VRPPGFHAFLSVRLRLAGKDVLDFGYGYGGRTLLFKELGARSVVGVEVMQEMLEMLEEGRAFAAQKCEKVSFLLTVGEALPILEDSEDVVCCYDVLEHVENVERCLREAYRALCPGGLDLRCFRPFTIQPAARTGTATSPARRCRTCCSLAKRFSQPQRS
jgi:ubiquinone/menaquinone biosynthesis C-methylase UbiE